jgi:molybdenum cofactor cytidylyltransferase
MGRDKALLPWPPVAEGATAVNTFLGAWIDLLQSETELVIVVAGHNAARIAPVVYGHGGFMIGNPEPDRGQFSSIQTGVQDVLNRGRDAAMIAPVDRPPVLPATIRVLKHAFFTANLETWGIVPELKRDGETVHGHPILVGRELIEAFLRAPTDSSARDIQHRHQQHLQYLPVEDPRIAMNIDTPEDYAKLRTTDLVASGTTF